MKNFSPETVVATRGYLVALYENDITIARQRGGEVGNSMVKQLQDFQRRILQGLCDDTKIFCRRAQIIHNLMQP